MYLKRTAKEEWTGWAKGLGRREGGETLMRTYKQINTPPQKKQASKPLPQRDGDAWDDSYFIDEDAHTWRYCVLLGS